MKDLQKLNSAANEIFSLAMDQAIIVKTLIKADSPEDQIKEAEDKLSTLTDAYSFILYRIISKIEEL
jgi:hypothetical protein